MNIRPPIVNTADRAVEPVFAATAYLTVPFPVPLAPNVIVNHEAEDVAVHAQPAVAVTAIDPVVAAPEILAIKGEIE